jgi:hypothetical protein
MSEFKHYNNHRPGSDPDNCGACALEVPQNIDIGNGETRLGINYAGWPLAYMQAGRRIPEAFMGFLRDELSRTDNLAYVMNLEEKLTKNGYDVAAIAGGKDLE